MRIVKHRWHRGLGRLDIERWHRLGEDHLCILLVAEGDLELQSVLALDRDGAALSGCAGDAMQSPLSSDLRDLSLALLGIDQS